MSKMKASIDFSSIEAFMFVLITVNVGSIRFIREQRFLLHDLTVDQAAVHVHILRLVIVIVVQLIIVEIERIAVFGYANFSVLRFRFLL